MNLPLDLDEDFSAGLGTGFAEYEVSGFTERDEELNTYDGIDQLSPALQQNQAVGGGAGGLEKRDPDSVALKPEKLLLEDEHQQNFFGLASLERDLQAGSARQHQAISGKSEVVEQALPSQAMPSDSVGIALRGLFNPNVMESGLMQQAMNGLSAGYHFGKQVNSLNGMNSGIYGGDMYRALNNPSMMNMSSQALEKSLGAGMKSSLGSTLSMEEKGQGTPDLNPNAASNLRQHVNASGAKNSAQASQSNVTSQAQRPADKSNLEDLFNSVSDMDSELGQWTSALEPHIFGFVSRLGGGKPASFPGDREGNNVGILDGVLENILKAMINQDDETGEEGVKELINILQKNPSTQSGGTVPMQGGQAPAPFVGMGSVPQMNPFCGFPLATPAMLYNPLLNFGMSSTNADIGNMLRAQQILQVQQLLAQTQRQEAEHARRMMSNMQQEAFTRPSDISNCQVQPVPVAPNTLNADLCAHSSLDQAATEQRSDMSVSFRASHGEARGVGHQANTQTSEGSNNAKKGTKRRRKPKIYTNPVPSNHCHICARSRGIVDLVTCSNLKNGTCLKVICDKCFSENDWDWKEAYANEQTWICCHCTGNCPSRAQCNIYRRTNDRRRMGGLKKRKAKPPQTPSSMASSSTLNIANKTDATERPSEKISEGTEDNVAEVQRQHPVQQPQQSPKGQQQQEQQVVPDPVEALNLSPSECGDALDDDLVLPSNFGAQVDDFDPSGPENDDLLNLPDPSGVDL